ncbi:hypothetical protein A2115_03700 [Candidatus Woesebacteria bacterium GWA1_41_8]|jgi:carboxypeptidase Taq|uniref:Metal-dependent carboxypeptidase n=1 Tax=Candidatus Woesebacteria bacterium GWA1_41_8 TaxID=1802471 RepID=A0A1F7WGG7_9BACT|nr:MAG: hypothetical protein A2115_03700 [Candidatus Woesebacteria bacterium GWA1_41_8]
MKSKSKNIQKLLEKYREISLLVKINSILGWDMAVNLPPKGAEGRAKQSAYLTKLITEKWLDPEFKKLIETTDDTKLSSEEKAVLRNLRHAGKFHYKVPKKVIVEFSEASSRAFMAWQEARRENNFKKFLPFLKKNVELNKKIANHLGYGNNPYDALLDIFEPGLTAEDVEAVFAKLQPELTVLITKIKKSQNYKKADRLVSKTAKFPQELQRELALEIIAKMGYDLDAGRMDISTHPFTEQLGSHDIRITNRYRENAFQESLMTAMHEAGHALYEQGVKSSYAGTPLEGGVSLGIHESQSRFWENQVGRSEVFAKYAIKLFRKYYPKEFNKMSSEDLFIVFNDVNPGFIRVEADEVTYNLHIALRFGLENGIINNKLKVEDLPEIWRSKMKDYLGVVPKTDREGVLQDVHWSHGMLGYFPTYTLGNLYAAQFAVKLKKQLDFDKLAGTGNLAPILSWLRKNIHQYGSLYWPKELIKKVTGEELKPDYFLAYIKDKYTKLYL